MSDERLDEVSTPPVLAGDADAAPEDAMAALDAVGAEGAIADAETGAEGAVDAPAATDGVSASSEGAEAPAARPREVIRGIHPELLCACPECEPDFVELQWFSPEEQKKTKGQIMLFCGHSGRKYFSPAVELHAWVTEHVTPKRGRAKGDG